MFLIRFFIHLTFIIATPLSSCAYTDIDFAKIRACFELTDYKVINSSKISEQPNVQFIGSLKPEKTTTRTIKEKKQKETTVEPFPLNALFIPDGDKLHIIQDIKTKPGLWGSLFVNGPVIRSFKYPKGYSLRSHCGSSIPKSVIKVGEKCGLKRECTPTYLGFGIGKGNNGKTRVCASTIGDLDPLKQAHIKDSDIPQREVKKLIEKALSDRLVFISENMGKGNIKVDYEKLLQASTRDGPCATAAGTSVLLSSSADLVVCPIDINKGVNCPTTDMGMHMMFSGEISTPATD